MKRLILAGLWAAVSCVVFWSGGYALAQDEKRVVVLEFEGRGAASVRKHVLAALKERSEVSVVSPKQAESARKKLGVRWGDPEAYQRVGAQLNVSAFVEGEVQKVGKKFRARIRVRDASSGSVVHEEPWTRKTLPQLKAVEENFWKVMGPHITASTAPAAAAPEPVREEPEPALAEPLEEPAPAPIVEAPEEEPASAERAPGERRTALIAWAGPRLMWRRLSYEQDTTLNSYRVPASQPAFNLALGASWFPGAHTRSDWLADFGVEAELDYSLGMKSRVGGKEYKTSAYELGAGVLYRIPLDSFEPRVRLGYVRHKFDADLPAGTPLPGVTYSSIRVGLGTAIHLVEWLGLDVNLAYLHVLDAGELNEKAYASNLGAHAFEFGGALVTRFKEYFGVRLGVDFRRYVLDFGNTTGPQALPEEGADHYLRTTLAFVFELPGGG